MSENKINSLNDMIYLAACVLHHIAPRADRLAEMDFEALYRKSRFHTMVAIICMALESGGMDSAQIKKWQDAKNKAVRKNMLLNWERQQIFQFMEEQGIWYMPLKGSVLKDLYPKMEMRQMADNDILFDSGYQYKLKDYMVGRGYRAKSVGKSNHDIYEKPPIYNFEMHTSLFGVAHNEVWVAYYKNVKDRLIKDEDNSCGYHFRDEDFYIYITTHAFKHYNGGGMGIRFLLDCYVYVWKKGEILDWEYIEVELEKLGVAEFERKSRILSQKLFGDPVHFYKIEMTSEEQKMLAYFSGSGTYGTTKNRVEKKLNDLQIDGKMISYRTKWNYYMKRLFPGVDWFRQHYPFCYRHKWTIPFFYANRIIRGILFRRSRLKNEVKIVWKLGEK